MQPTLLILAAGIGSRYGGLKQVDGMGQDQVLYFIRWIVLSKSWLPGWQMELPEQKHLSTPKNKLDLYR